MSGAGRDGVADTAANVLSNLGALQADSQIGSIAVVDTASAVLADAAALAAVPAISSIAVVDTAANILANSAALAADSAISAEVVLDSAVNVAANIDALNSAAGVDEILLTDSGTPTLTLTVAQTLGDATALQEIGNPSYAIDVSDTAANVSANIDALSADSQIAAITLTDGGTPALALTASQVVNDDAALAEIVNSSYAITVSSVDAVTAGSQIQAIRLRFRTARQLKFVSARRYGRRYSHSVPCIFSDASRRANGAAAIGEAARRPPTAPEVIPRALKRIGRCVAQTPHRSDDRWFASPRSAIRQAAQRIQ